MLTIKRIVFELETLLEVAHENFILLIYFRLSRYGMYLGMMTHRSYFILRCFMYALSMILMMLLMVSGKAVEAGFIDEMICFDVMLCGMLC